MISTLLVPSGIHTIGKRHGSDGQHDHPSTAGRATLGKEMKVSRPTSRYTRNESNDVRLGPLQTVGRPYGDHVEVLVLQSL